MNWFWESKLRWSIPSNLRWKKTISETEEIRSLNVELKNARAEADPFCARFEKELESTAESYYRILSSLRQRVHLGEEWHYKMPAYLAKTWKTFYYY